MNPWVHIISMVTGPAAGQAWWCYTATSLWQRIELVRETMLIVYLTSSLAAVDRLF